MNYYNICNITLVKRRLLRLYRNFSLIFINTNKYLCYFYYVKRAETYLMKKCLKTISLMIRFVCILKYIRQLWYKSWLKMIKFGEKMSGI